MRLLATALLLVTLSGCFSALDVCPENLNLTEPLSYDRIPDLDAFQQAYGASISQGGEVYHLDIFAADDTYYVRYQPAHFSTQRVYGPFNGSWEEGIACAED